MEALTEAVRLESGKAGLPENVAGLLNQPTLKPLLLLLFQVCKPVIPIILHPFELSFLFLRWKRC